MYAKSRQILKALKSVCLENRKEKLYLANSKDLVQLIIELELTDYWPSLKFDKQVQDSLNRASQIGGFRTATAKLVQTTKSQ